jgi:hypothetical protein
LISDALETVMQETTVGWNPMYESRLPWFTKVFVVYLLLVLFASVFRAIRLMWHLRGLRKMEQEIPSPPMFRFQLLLWETSYAKTASIKNLSVLTFLLTLLVFAWSTTRILLGVTMEKVTGVGFLAGAMAEVLTTFSLGILVCAVLYAFAIFYEAALMRHQMRFDRAKNNNHLPPTEQPRRNKI